MTSSATHNRTRQTQSLHELLRRMHLRMTIITVGLIGLTTLVLGSMIIRTYTTNNLELIGRSAAYTAEAAVVFDDRIAIAESLAWAISSKEVSRIAVTDANDNIIWSSYNTQSGPTVVLFRWIDRLFFPDAVETPIVHRSDDYTVGSIKLWGNANGMLSYLAIILSGTLACMLLTAFGVTYFTRRLQCAIVKPLENFTEVTHRVRRERTFNRRLPHSSVTEFSKLADDFNALLEELDTWQDNMRSENASLTHLAMHDSLTGLPNRAAFEEGLSKAVRQAKASGRKLALLFLDNDYFKQTNDQYGHAAGDAVLVQVASRIRAQLRDRDLVGRIGGDEFAVLITALTSEGEEKRVAERIMEAMKPPIELYDGTLVKASLSIGIATFPDPCKDEATLLRMADAAMYAEKRTRKPMLILSQKEMRERLTGEGA